MLIQSIELERAWGHGTMRVPLPDRGLVIVTGDNGTGKSSIFVESPAWALWGETVRGTPGWPADGGARFAVQTPGLRVVRSRTGKTTKLELAGELAPQAGATPTKTQAGLEQVIGGFATWRRVHVFSALEASIFGEATDAERKRLLEDLIGLEVFDAGQAACAQEARQADQACRSAERQQAVAATAQQSAVDELARARQAWDALERQPVPVALSGPDPQTRTSLAGMVAELDAAIQALANQRGAAYDHASRLGRDAISRAAELQAAQRTQGGTCPTCGQPVPHRVDCGAARAAHDQAVRVAQQATQQAADLDVRLTALRADRQELQEGLVAWETRARQADERARQVRQWAGWLDQERAKVRACEERLRACQQACQQADHELARARLEVAELGCCARVLGPQGVRAAMLGGCLAGLQQVACAWLARLGMPDLRVQLAPQQTTKQGGVSEKIAFEVLGAGAGYGYRAASTSERRRVDLACMLALAEIALGARGVKEQRGTLFFDEMLDTLDARGRQATMRVLQEIARQRPVVVITHAQDLATELAGLSGAWHYHVSRQGVARAG